MLRGLACAVVLALCLLAQPQHLAGAPGDVLTAPVDAPAPAEAPESVNIADGDYSVSSQTGAASYQHAIDVPPGRNGMAPQLAITCTSQGALYGGLAAGCSLAIPSIEIDTSQGVLAEPRFLSTLAGGMPLEPVDDLGPGLSRPPLDLAPPGASPPSPPPGVGMQTTYRARHDSSYARYDD